MRKTIKFLILVVAVLAVTGLVLKDKIQLYFASENSTINSENVTFFIDEKMNLDVLALRLKKNGIIKKENTIITVGKYKGLDSSNLALGKYEIQPKTNIKTLLNGFTLNSNGNGNAEVEVVSTFNTCRDIYDVAGKASANIQCDSAKLVNYILNDATLKKYGFNKATISSLFLPNSYNMYWDTNEEEFVVKMAAQYKKFWNADRKKKLKNIGLKNQSDLATLASIVYSEQNRLDSEWGTIGRLYLNRVKDNWLLQSDPTFRFCWGDELKGVKRLTFEHRAIDCPYNTYKYAGLPPGPICIPPAKVMDAILNSKKNNYYFMCAKPGYSGEHNFANSLSEHNRNANVYQNWLTAEKIK